MDDGIDMAKIGRRAQAMTSQYWCDFLDLKKLAEIAWVPPTWPQNGLRPVVWTSTCHPLIDSCLPGNVSFEWAVTMGPHEVQVMSAPPGLSRGRGGSHQYSLLLPVVLWWQVTCSGALVTTPRSSEKLATEIPNAR